MAKEQLIKVRLDNESLWAKPIKKNIAEIRNIPYKGKLSWMDIVKHDDEGNIIKIVKKKTKRASIVYSYPFLFSSSKEEKENKNKFNKKWKRLLTYFRKNKIEIESMIEGHASLATPLKMTKSTLNKIINKSPVLITHFYFN